MDHHSTGTPIEGPPSLTSGWFSSFLFHPSPSGQPLRPPSLTLSAPFQVSKASSELMNYCEQHARSDPLLVGVPASENPFKDKKPCTIL
uniref:Guanine nucleotide-binding protein subunit gamma n=1 Tax=Meleagris gallopavo TaxID=9103 RepID=A0A803YHL4_MELGA